MGSSALPWLLVFTLALFACDGGGRPSPGGDAGPRDSGSEPECRGVATPCSAFVGHCEDQEACYQGGECYGSPTPCSLISSPGQCGGAYGCDWRDGRCQGTARPCASSFGEGSCGFQLGCLWRDGCQGSGWECQFEFSETGCLSVHGCRWE